MAENLARILGSEDDRVNCPFFLKNGACRYGARCSRQHLKPTKSVTLLFSHMYQNPAIAIALAEGHQVPDEEILKVIEHFESFFAEVFLEVAQWGEIEEMHIVDNLGEHMIGNAYIKFVSEDDAERVKKNISGRYYGGRLVMPEYSPVVDFREGRCRQFDTNSCRRGSNCNFMHIKVVRKELLRVLFNQMYIENPQYKQSKDRHKSHRRREHSESPADKHKKIKKHKSEKSDKRSSKRERHDEKPDGQETNGTRHKNQDKERDEDKNAKDDDRFAFFREEKGKAGETDQRDSRRDERKGEHVERRRRDGSGSEDSRRNKKHRHEKEKSHKRNKEERRKHRHGESPEDAKKPRRSLSPEGKAPEVKHEPRETEQNTF